MPCIKYCVNSTRPAIIGNRFTVITAMKQLKLKDELIRFFEPSFAGLTLYLIVYILILGQRILSSSHHLLSGISISTFYGTWLYSLGHRINLFLALTSVGKTVIFGLWLGLGAIIYILANFMTNNIKELATDVSRVEGRYIIPVGVNKNSDIFEFIERFIIRLVAIIIGFFYANYILHLYTVWLKKPNDFHNLSLHSLNTSLLLLIAVFGFLHILVLLIRLVTLRLRVFKGAHSRS
jgi:hypothetical protein